MAKDPRPDSRADLEDLERAAQARRDADLRLPMSERLAKLHHLCKQTTALAGSAKRA